MSAMRGSSGLGSAISSWMELSSVEMFREGLHAPFEGMVREKPLGTKKPAQRNLGNRSISTQTAHELPQDLQRLMPHRKHQVHSQHKIAAAPDRHHGLHPVCLCLVRVGHPSAQTT